MARIPIYEERQAVNQNISVSRLRTPDTGARFIARGVQDVGRALETTANVMMKVEEERSKVTADKLSSEAELYWTEQLKVRQSSPDTKVEGFAGGVIKDFDAYAEEMLKNQPEGLSRKFLAANLRSLKKSVYSSSVNFEATQGIAVRNAEMEASIGDSARAIALDPNEANGQRLYGQRLAAIDSLRTTPSNRAQLKEKLNLTFGRAGAESMARNQPQVLMAQVDAARKRGDKASSGNYYLDLLPSTEWDTYIKIAEGNVSAANAEVAANDVWKELGPKNDRMPVNKDAMYRRIDELMSDRTPAERKAAKALIDNQASAFDYSSNQRRAATQAGIFDQVLAGKGLDEIMKSPQYKALDGADKLSIIGKIKEAQSKSADDVGATARYLELTSNPEKLAAMTDAEISAEMPVLGNSLTKDLLKRRASLNDPANVIEAKIDEDTFKRLADSAGLKPYESKKSAKQNSELGRLKYAVELQIDIEQRDKKRKLTPEEKEKIMQQVIDNKVFVDRSFRTDPEVPIALVETDKLGDTYVVVNGQEVKLSTIPATSRAKIVRQLRAARQPVTEKAIAEIYILSKSQPSAPAQAIPQ